MEFTLHLEEYSAYTNLPSVHNEASSELASIVNVWLEIFQTFIKPVADDAAKWFSSQN